MSLSFERVICAAVSLLLGACPGPEPSAPTTPPGMTPPAAGEPTEPVAADGTATPVEPATAAPVAPTRPAVEPAPPTPPVKPTAEPAGVMNGIVAAHNEVRALHCAPPLTWSREVAAVAQKWADHLRDAGCKFEHSPGGKYGENLSYLSPAGIGRPAAITRGWYDEVRDYDFSKPGFAFNTGHFTQVVWRGTERLGCGVAQCANAEIWVCNYDPPGNWRGMYREQVLPTGCDR